MVAAHEEASSREAWVVDAMLKMSSAPEGGEEENPAAGDDNKKSERKRQRERERRSNLAQAFDDLASILTQIEPDANDEEVGSRQRRRRNSVDNHEIDTGDNAGLTRLDLIGRSVDMLRRLHEENARLKKLVEEKGGEGKATQKPPNVLLMAPTLTKMEQKLEQKPDRPVSSAQPTHPHPSYPPPTQAPPPPPHHYYSQPPPPVDYRYYPSQHPPPPGYPPYHYGSGGWTTSTPAPAPPPSLPPPHHQLPPPISHYPPPAATAPAPTPVAVPHGKRPSPPHTTQQPQPPRHYESPQPSARPIHRTNSKS